MITILDCEAVEAQTLKKTLDRLNIQSMLARSADAIDNAHKVIIPHCKSIRRFLAALRDQGLVGPLLRAIDRGCPVLGISNGLHLLFDVTYQEGQHVGLGVIHGKIADFDFGAHPAAEHFSIPHMGWNQVHWVSDSPLTNNIESGAYFYFDHSSHPEPLDERNITATCNHGVDFSAIVNRDRVFGTQFLPERSDEVGETLLKNFAGLS